MEINTEELMRQFNESSFKWNVPFPMAVFGTLRAGWGNHYLMGTKDGERPRFKSHHKAFLPHFVATGLSIKYSPDSSAVCEVYTYDAENWARMIPNVDGLEGFRPGRERHYSGGYHRTLMNLHILPDDFQSPFYENERGYGRGWGSVRDLQIPKTEWGNYPKVPCWIYSSVYQNQECLIESDTPFIWDGTKI